MLMQTKKPCRLNAPGQSAVLCAKLTRAEGDAGVGCCLVCVLYGGEALGIRTVYRDPE